MYTGRIVSKVGIMPDIHVPDAIFNHSASFLVACLYWLKWQQLSSEVRGPATLFSNRDQPSLNMDLFLYVGYNYSTML